VETKLNMSLQCSIVAKKGNNILGCIRKNLISRPGGAINPLYSALVRPYLECCRLCGAPEYEVDLSILHSPAESHHYGQQLEHLAYEERLKELGLFNLEKRRLRVDLPVCVNTCWKRTKKREPGPVKGQEAMGTN